MAGLPSTVHQIFRQAAQTIPQVRSLIDARDAALASRDLAVAGRQSAEAALASAVSSQSELFRRFLNACAPDCWLRLELNGAKLWLPRDTLLTMFHCLHTGGAKLYLAVEERHLNWMMQHLEDGGTFLDVGAATGATTLPIVLRFGDAVRNHILRARGGCQDSAACNARAKSHRGCRSSFLCCRGCFRNRRVSRVPAR